MLVYSNAKDDSHNNIIYMPYNPTKKNTIHGGGTIECRKWKWTVGSAEK